MSRVVVLGAGIAGLTAAFRRTSPGETVVLEASGRIGGSVHTIREDGFVLEGGPNTLRTSEAAERLLRDLSLEGEVIAADEKAPRYIMRGGAPRAIVPGPAGLFTPALSFGGKLRILKEWRVPPRATAADDESVHDFFRRRFGEEVARYAAGPIVSGVYAGDPASLSVRSAFPRLWIAEGRSGGVIKDFWRSRKEPRAPRPRTLNFRNGLAALTEALAGRAHVETGAAVAALEGPLTGGPAWRVHAPGGRTFEADVVVSTLGAPAVARLLGDRLPRSGAALASVPSSPLAVVVQAFRPEDPSAAPRGFGVLIPRGEGFRSLGILYPASLFAGRAPAGVALTTCFLGGALDPALASAPDEELFAIAEDETRRVHARIGARAGRWLFRWPAAIPQLPLGHHRTLSLLEEDLAELNRETPRPALVVTGAWRDGVSLGERITSGEAIGQGL